MALGGGYPGETLDALWNLVWRGLVTNDALQALRAYCDAASELDARSSGEAGASAGRLPLAPDDAADGAGAMVAECGCVRPRAVLGDERGRHAIAQQLLTRYGVVFRETAHAEGLPGGFSAVYDVLKAMEEIGTRAARILRGGPRSDAVRHARGGGPAAQPAGGARGRDAARC